MRVVLRSTLAFAALMVVVMRHTFDGTDRFNSFVLVFTLLGLVSLS